MHLLNANVPVAQVEVLRVLCAGHVPSTHILFTLQQLSVPDRNRVASVVLAERCVNVGEGYHTMQLWTPHLEDVV